MFEKPLQWQQLPNGLIIQEQVQQAVEPWLRSFVGEHLLKFGALSAAIDSQSCPVKRHFSGYDDGEVDIRFVPECLPIQSHSIDVGLMSFVLDFEADPHALLRELDRTIIAGGHLIIVGFNPLSGLLLGQALPNKRKQFPWCGRFFLSARICDWLSLLGYQVIDNQRMLPHHLLTPMNPQGKLQQFADRHFGYAGSVYMIVAKKVSLPLTPIRKRQRLKSRKWQSIPSAGRYNKTKS
ncbi:class I SAM-dependent methyltransferase [Paraferrimonas haliotis]|uniref:class I SAM-dependent methyltransferase n=1 Tax=Paraferrimonas haliotis TaxID=2013866 RepID=UPI000BA952D3|nr:methyltransferase domain-containing protein [Paraferrimonas haliotis]